MKLSSYKCALSYCRAYRHLASFMHTTRFEVFPRISHKKNSLIGLKNASNSNGEVSYITTARPKPHGYLMSGILAWLGLQKDPEEEEDALTMTVKRGMLAAQQGDLVKAEQIFHIALRLATDLNHEAAITHIYCLLANTALERGHIGQAEKLFKSVLERILSSGTSQDDNAVVEISLKLAAIFYQKGELEKAKQGLDFCVDTQKKKVDSLGDTEDEDIIGLMGMCLDKRAQFLLGQHKLGEAAADLREAVKISQRLNGPQDQQTLVVSNSLATVLSLKGEHKAAAELMADVIATSRITNDEYLPSFLINLGLMKLREGLIVEAKKSCQEGLRLTKDEEIVKEARDCLESIEGVK